MVLAQYYNFVRFGKAGYRMIMEIMQENAEQLAADIASIGPFQIIGKGEETLPLVAFNLAEEQPYDEFDIAFQLGGARLDASRLHDAAGRQRREDDAGFVKVNLSRSLVDRLVADIADAVKTLEARARSPPPSGRRSGPTSATERLQPAGPHADRALASAVGRSNACITPPMAKQSAPVRVPQLAMSTFSSFPVSGLVNAAIAEIMKRTEPI